MQVRGDRKRSRCEVARAPAPPAADDVVDLTDAAAEIDSAAHADLPVIPRGAVALMPHQVEHAASLVDTLRDFNVGFDTSDTGTGKTYTSCKVAEELGCPCVVVVCPSIVERKWTQLLGSASDERKKDDWMVFPYSLLNQIASKNGLFRFWKTEGRRTSIDGRGKLVEHVVGDDVRCSMKPGTKLARLLGSRRTLLVLDETHRVKNATAQISKAIRELTDRVRAAEGWILHVSATPFDQVFQLPQYLSLMGAEDEARARFLVEKTSEVRRSKPRSDVCWDVMQVMECVVGSARFRSLDDALYALAKNGSDVGKNWARLRAFASRLKQIASDPYFDWSAGVVPVHACDRVRRHIRDLNSTRDCDATALECLMWPFAIQHLGADIELAIGLVGWVLPRVMFRMQMPDYGFGRFDVELFLESVDASLVIAEIAYLPKYRELNDRRAPAPLVSPDGKHRVPEEKALGWRRPEWRLGEREPVEVWREIMEASDFAPSAKAAHDVCLVAWQLREKSGELADGDGDEEDRAADEKGGLILLECIKVPSMIALTKHILDSDPGSKVVVMFTYLRPLDQFENACIQELGHRPLRITGTTRMSKRAVMIENWTQRVLVCTASVMNEGIDLHDTRGDQHRYLIMTPAPNAVVGEQALGRIYRAGVRSHAINCVVYGGKNLGGVAERQLIARLNTKKATMGTSEPTHVLESTEKFKELIAEVHALGTRAAGARVVPASLVDEDAQLNRVTFANKRWWRKELAARMWVDVKHLRDFPGSYCEPGWKEEFRRIAMDDDLDLETRRAIETSPFPHMAQKQISRCMLSLSKEIVDRHTWLGMWPSINYLGTDRGYGVGNAAAFRALTYEAFLSKQDVP